MCDSQLIFDQKKRNKFHNLTNVNCQFESYDDETIKNVLIYLTDNENIENIRITMKGMNNDFIQKFSKKIYKMKKLKTIFVDLSFNEHTISEESLIQLYNALKNCTILEKIDFKYNSKLSPDNKWYNKLIEL